MKKLTDKDAETKSADIVAKNLERLRELFPEAFTEGKVDFEVLKQLLNGAVDEREEKYGLNWHGKRRARQLALTPSAGTLRPCSEDSVDWDTTQNLIIEGDNLEVLKLLQKSYAGKVKLIYIDPPYNTGKDFVYPDNFQDSIKNYLELTGQVEGGQKITSNTESSGRFHTDWLNMMYPRIKLARALLRDDGLFISSIDDGEVAGLKLILNDVFGEENFCGQIVWQKKASGSQHSTRFLDFHEYLLVYSKKDDELDDLSVERTDEQLESFTMADGFLEERGKFLLSPLKSYLAYRPTLIYDIECPDGTKINTQWVCAEPTFMKLKAEGRILFKKGRESDWQVYKKQYERDRGGRTKPASILLKHGSTMTGKNDLKELGLDGCFDFPKPVSLLRHLLDFGSDSNSIVLDLFAGSGTTGQAVLEQNVADGGNRRFILVQLPENPGNYSDGQDNPAAALCDKLGKPRNIVTIAEERLRRAGKKIKDENPMFAGDLGFRVFKLASSNIQAWEPNRDDLPKTLQDSVDHLKTDRTEQDILFELLLKLGLDLTVPIEQKTIAGKTVHSVGAGTLLVCLAPQIKAKEVEPLALGIMEWHKQLAPAGDTQVVFRDSAFANDVAKTNLTAILQQHGLENVRSL